MRKIEKEMNLAISGYRNWQEGNTRVEHFQEKVSVFLYNHLIAEIGDNYIILYDGGGRTATTKSRLNAILSGNGKGNEKVYQKDREWRISYDEKDEPFVSGMTI
jgi:hypothetical protein